jgi:hypothetical protein
VSEQQMSVGDDTATDTGADSDIDEIAQPLAGAKHPLADGGSVGVIAELDVEPGGFGEHGAQGGVFEALDVGHGKDKSGDVILYSVTEIANGKVIVDGNHQ